MNDVPLCCNQCWNKLVEGKAFKTSCDHCFCENCADATFSNRNRRCSCCNLEVSSVLEFQVVGQPILDDQLTDVRSTLQAIACANGAGFLDSWIASLHRFERNQLAAWGNRQGIISQNALVQAEQREKELGERELQARQMLITLEHENDQLRKERENFQRGVTDLQAALEERTRQAENWRAMYEALKSGGRVSIPPAQASTSVREPAPQQLPPPQQQQHHFAPSSLGRKLRPDSNRANTFENYRYNEDDRSQQQQQAPPPPRDDRSRERSSEYYSQPQQQEDRGRFAHSMSRAESFSGPSSSNLRMPPPSPSPAFASSSSFPGRSSSLPPANMGSLRPPTRDTLTSLLNRSVVPRNAATASSTTMMPPFRLPGSNAQQDPVRSSFFSSSSLRGMSPSVNSNGSGNQQGRGRLSQGGMLH